MSETHDHDEDKQQQQQQEGKPTKSFSAASTCSCSSSFSFFLRLFSDPFIIFFQNKHIFIPILLLLTLPLCFLLLSLSFSSRPLKRRILHLESLATYAATRFEARHVLHESREESLSLLRLKLFYSLPSSVLSLLSFVATVHATSIPAPQRPSLPSTAAALKFAWKRVLVTSLCSYALFLFYVQLLQFFAAAFRNHPWLRLATLLIGTGFEVYLMGVLGVGLVVAALEEKHGWEAIRVSSELMAGKRFCWWWVNCMLVATSGWIGKHFGKLTDGEDSLKWGISTAVMRWEMVVICLFYGVVVIWSFIVATVFYCGCKKRLDIRGAIAIANANESLAAVDLTDLTE